MLDLSDRPAERTDLVRSRAGFDGKDGQVRSTGRPGPVRGGCGLYSRKRRRRIRECRIPWIKNEY